MTASPIARTTKKTEDDHTTSAGIAPRTTFAAELSTLLVTPTDYTVESVPATTSRVPLQQIELQTQRTCSNDLSESAGAGSIPLQAGAVPGR